jgi:hypothetical protein
LTFEEIEALAAELHADTRFAIPVSG